MDKILVTRTEAAEALGLSVRAIDYLLAQGKLQSRKIGKRRLIPRAAIESFARRDHARIAPPTPESLLHSARHEDK